MTHEGDNAETILTPHRSVILGKAGVTGYSTSFRCRIRAGQATDELCLRIYVQHKLPLTALPLADRIPAEIDGIPTDVVETGDVTAQLFGSPGINTVRVRPVKPGYSVGHHQVTAGTIGAIGLYQRWPIIISNNHVLANSSSEVMPGRAGLYDHILQPGIADGGRDPQDQVAWLAWWEPLSLSVPNHIDAACAWLVPSAGWDGAISGDWVRGRRDITWGEMGLLTHKTGRTTGLTTDKRIFDAMAVLQIGFPIGTLLFEDIFLTESQSQGGDSGSLVLSEDNMALGLLFAGSDLLSAVCKLKYLPTEISLIGAI